MRFTALRIPAMAAVLLGAALVVSAADNEPLDTDDNGHPDHVRVTDWDGDGTLEMSDVQSAVDALTDPGWKEVVVGSGEYAGPEPGDEHVLELPSRIVLRGDVGGGTILKGFGPDDLLSAGAVVTNRDHLDGNSDITIRDLVIDGGWGSGDATGFGHARMGVYFNDCTNCRVVSTTVRDTLHACLYSKNGDHVEFVDNTLLSCGNFRGTGDGYPCIYLFATSGRVQRNVLAAGNICAGAGGPGLNTRRQDPSAVLTDIRFIGNSVSDMRAAPLPAPCIGIGGIDGGVFSDNSCVNTGSVVYASSDYYSGGTDANASRGLLVEGLSVRPAAEGHGLEVRGFLEDSSFRDIEVTGISSNRFGLVFQTPLTDVVFERIRLTECAGTALSEAAAGSGGSGTNESLTFRDFEIEYANDADGGFPAVRFTEPVENLLIDGFDIIGAPGDGIRFMDDVNGATIRNLRILSASGHGVAVAPGSVVRGLAVHDTTIEESGGCGLSLVVDSATTSSAIDLESNSIRGGCTEGGEDCSAIYISGASVDVWIGGNLIEDEGASAFGVYHDVAPFEDPTYLCTNEFLGALNPGNRFFVGGADAAYRDDSDGDLAVNGCDCAPLDGATYPGAVESNDGLDNNCPGDGDYGIVDETSGVRYSKTSDFFYYDWTAQSGATLYQVARSAFADFRSCESAIVAGNRLMDVSMPAPGAAFYFLNRPVTPRVGSWGQDSQDDERDGLCSSSRTDRGQRRLPARRGRAR